ncbi:ankyrin repeat domain-containing protein 50-like isoform X2 [Littorina saxatilis]|uniref:SOCS box domain-containing protein n=1 Tax=Littorina saxatilis TaxID=31220 RepID=A0AAN9GMT8_9CAEN
MHHDQGLNTGRRLKRQQITPFTPEQELSRAIKNNEGLDKVRRLVEEKDADISGMCDGYWTPLTLAAHLGKQEIVSFLLHCIKKASQEPTPQYQWRTTVDSVNDRGETPLVCAARHGHTDVCRTLLEAGADVNFRCHFNKQTALLVAVESSQRSVLEVLLGWGADVQLTDNVGITPLYAAVKGDNCGMVRQLIDAGCDVNIGSQDHAPLFLAARRGFQEIVQILCEAGCYKDIANKYGVTPLYEAALTGQNNILHCLIDQGCDIDKYDMYNVSPLQAAVTMGNTECVKMLVQAGACLKWRNKQGKCAVQLALELGKNDIVEFFLKSGVDVTKRPNLAFTAPGRMSFLHNTFEWSVLPKTMLLLLRGCSGLNLCKLTNVDCFRFHPIMLELALASGLCHPPSRLLAEQDLNDFEPACQHWLQEFRTTPQTLKNLSRCCVRHSLGNTILCSAPQLPLPAMLVNYVTFADAVIDD